MSTSTSVPNRLINEKSPYLLQHAYNPVDWFPWGEEAFEKAKREDKPIFLSIGYSTCHWCHVMERESFEDDEVAKLLNRDFVSIKVDRELRPDIDSIYMSICQAITGSGGWPMSIFLTPDQKPFFVGTYFPKMAGYGQIGFIELLNIINQKWKEDKKPLLESAENTLRYINSEDKIVMTESKNLLQQAITMYKRSFDKKYGGFGSAPKFPAAHNLILLMSSYEEFSESIILDMVEKTLNQMYKGGIFDHIGGGFFRYSTDTYFLVPHFEKMLYDNALLMMAYAGVYKITKKECYGFVAEKTAAYILKEMTDEQGGLYSALDADSEGEEGKYYTLLYDEVIQVLGAEQGKQFCQFYGISPEGNFEGKNIPNMLHHKGAEGEERYKEAKKRIYDYRKQRMTLHVDDKILTSWNGLMIAAFAVMYQVFGKDEYLQAAQRAEGFICENLIVEDTLYVGYREGNRMLKGFLDEYACYAFALIRLYDATLEEVYLQKAEKFLDKAKNLFSDTTYGGFFLSGSENEQLISRPKETYDGAIPSGNSVMAYNLVRIAELSNKENWKQDAESQLEFMKGKAGAYPIGYSFFLMALLQEMYPPEHVVCVLKNKEDLKEIKGKTNLLANVIVMDKPTEEYPLINDATSYYVCKNFSCLPPTNKYDDFS